ncbi:MAG: PD-(D/E)XK nuclease domain-containing protein, partial [Desulfovibrionaceae bacterium]|nr:PD-(D/E)XK nuclease domain-containing protein [Desulfovibrionaceae bacterium]
IVTGPTSAHAAVIEVRYSGTSEAMLKDAEDALSRLRGKRYAENFEGPYKKIMLWGISFCNKSCVARAGEFLKATDSK